MRPFHGNRRVRRAYKADRMRELLGLALKPPKPEPVVEHGETTVPAVDESVSIEAVFHRLLWGRREADNKEYRVTIEPGGIVSFQGCRDLLPHHPTSRIVDGWREFEAVDRNDWERKNGFGLTFMKEEDWQRLLKKAQKEARS